MSWARAIRRLVPFVRCHAADLAFLCLIAVGLVFGGGAALQGLLAFAENLDPAAAADASATPANIIHLAAQANSSSRAYAPQVLFPIRTQAFPDWLLKPPQPPPPRGMPVIAICIDDLGEDIAGTDKAMALPGPVALSFLPFADATGFLASEAAKKGHEVLAHVPMEAEGSIDPGPMALRTGADNIAERLEWHLARVPGAIGINNHEGSKFTADAGSLTPVVKELAARHLFFFDSRTGTRSKVVAVARHFGVESAGRDVFLDDTVTEAAVAGQLQALAATARAQGVAIAIGHPHEVTLRMLAAWLAQNHGVRLVPLSQALAMKSGMEVAAR